MIDEQLTFSDAQAITADAPSTNHLDLGASYRPGPGERVSVRIHIGDSFATATAVTFALQTADDDSFSSPLTLASLTKTVADSLNAGDVYEIVYPVAPAGRYVRMHYSVDGANASAGTVTATLALASGGQTHQTSQ